MGERGASHLCPQTEALLDALGEVRWRRTLMGTKRTVDTEESPEPHTEEGEVHQGH